MKVALSFPGCHRRGGVERIMLEAALFLAKQGHDVNVFANEWEPNNTESIRFHYVQMQQFPFFLRGTSYHNACTRTMNNAAFDIVNTFGCVCPTGGVHWVQSVQRAWLERSKVFRPPFSAARIRQRLNPLHPMLLRLEAQHFQERNYRVVIAATQQVKEDLQRLYTVPPADVIVLPNGFAPNEFNPQRRAERRTAMRIQLDLQPENIVLLFVANELERKGYKTILAAMQQLKDPRLRLLVVGRPDRQLVMEEAKRFGVETQVLACGATKDVASYHAASDIFVLPTQYEAFCLAILEALGSGLPVITSHVPGAYDAIQPGINGYLIDDPKSGDQLATALKPLLEPDLRKRLSSNAPETVRSYQWPTVLQRYEQILLQHRC